MATVSEVVEAVVGVIVAALPEIDEWDTAQYLPAVETQQIALIATALGHTDEGYVYSAGWMQVTHRLRLELWTKLDQGDIETGIQRARDAGYRAMKALVAADVGGGYTLAAAGTGVAMTYQVEPQIHTVGDIPFLRGVLMVPVWQKETV